MDDENWNICKCKQLNKNESKWKFLKYAVKNGNNCKFYILSLKNGNNCKLLAR